MANHLPVATLATWPDNVDTTGALSVIIVQPKDTWHGITGSMQENHQGSASKHWAGKSPSEN